MYPVPGSIDMVISSFSIILMYAWHEALYNKCLCAKCAKCVLGDDEKKTNMHGHHELASKTTGNTTVGPTQSLAVAKSTSDPESTQVTQTTEVTPEPTEVESTTPPVAADPTTPPV